MSTAQGKVGAGKANKAETSSAEAQTTAPVQGEQQSTLVETSQLSEVTDYGRLGRVAYDFINRKIQQHPNLKWNVHGNDLQVVKLCIDGRLYCKSTATTEEGYVDLSEGAAFEQLMKKLNI